MNSSRVICITLIILGIFSSSVWAETDEASDKILRQLFNARHPEGLISFTCRAEMETSVVDEENSDASVIDLFNLPSLGMDIIYIAPYDYRVLVDQLPARADDAFAFMRLRGDDPLTLTNPGIREALTSLYDVEYDKPYTVGEEKLHMLKFTPMHADGPHSEFILLVRDSDGLPVSSALHISFDDGKATILTEIEYEEIDEYMLPSRVSTTFQISGDSNVTLETTTRFTDYVINPDDLTIPDKYDDDNDGDIDSTFEDLYRGFEAPAIEITLNDDSLLEIGLVLEIESSKVRDEIDEKSVDILLAIEITLTGRNAAELKNRRFETGRELMGVINDLLEAGDVTDIYFTTYKFGK